MEGMNTKTRMGLQAWIDADGWSAVADSLNVTQNTLARWLAGLSRPHPNTAEKLDAALRGRRTAK